MQYPAKRLPRHYPYIRVRTKTYSVHYDNIPDEIARRVLDFAMSAMKEYVESGGDAKKPHVLTKG